jgi:hypothetical protein
MNDYLSNIGLDNGGAFTPTEGNSFNLSPITPDSQYEWQDQMEQARNTNVPSGSSTSWDRGSSSGFDASSAQKLLSQALKSQQGVAQQNQQMYSNTKPMDVVRQAAFLPTPGAINVQDKQTDLAALIKALRG